MYVYVCLCIYICVIYIHIYDRQTRYWYVYDPATSVGCFRITRHWLIQFFHITFKKYQFMFFCRVLCKQSKLKEQNYS